MYHTNNYVLDIQSSGLIIYKCGPLLQQNQENEIYIDKTESKHWVVLNKKE